MLEQDLIRRCFINDAPLRGSVFDAGTVLVQDCLFAGEVPAMPASFLARGRQQAYVGTRFAFTASLLLNTCPDQVPAEWTPVDGRTREVSQHRSPYGMKRLVIKTGHFLVILCLLV
jgi:hypothetical protein